MSKKNLPSKGNNSSSANYGDDVNAGQHDDVLQFECAQHLILAFAQAKQIVQLSVEQNKDNIAQIARNAFELYQLLQRNIQNFVDRGQQAIDIKDVFKPCPYYRYTLEDLYQALNQETKDALAQKGIHSL